ncbi:MAG: hypothetical protein ACYDAC_04490 [Candidatus Dormibacteria bacterium]
MRVADRYELAEELRTRYAKAGRVERGALLEAFCLATGYHRRYACHHLFTHCTERGIAFTRSRPFHKNDNCHVEQKNWTLVRRLIGYDRLDTPEQLAWLDDFYTRLLRPFANCFQPVMKLVAKEAVEQRTRRLYDTPATPLRRLLDRHADRLEFTRLASLTDLYTTTSPLSLKRAIDRRLAAVPVTLGGRDRA